MRIRDEEPRDRTAVRGLVAAEFDTGGEADLVDALREQAQPLVSLVAEEEGNPVGHVMFSPVTLDSDPELKLMGLAPLAVHYDFQGRGIGSALVRAGLERCMELGAVAVVVLGHGKYYSRFGFEPASRRGIDSEYDVPSDAFMVLELTPGALSGKSGHVKFHASFANL